MTDLELKDATSSSPKVGVRLPRIFIDGEHGTTGLQIRQRLAGRADIEILSVPAAERRNESLRADLLNKADIAILCLPDDASRQAVSMLEAAGNETCRLIDASTAHRTAPNWVFGFAEMTASQREAIASARFVANPGCYSTGAIALLRPLTEAGLLPSDAPVTINAISGYTGGGKNLIAKMEDRDHADAIGAHYYLYALSLEHKHLPEIMMHSGLKRTPIFTPSVGRFRQGMLVSLPLHLDLMRGTVDAEQIYDALARHYEGQDIVRVLDLAHTSQLERLDPEALVGTDCMELHVFASADGGRVNLVASLDNLGKGASGAAVQCLDIMLNG